MKPDPGLEVTVVGGALASYDKYRGEVRYTRGGALNAVPGAWTRSQGITMRL